MYWDLYLLVNLVFNAVLLHGTATLAGRPVGPAAILRGAALGSAYAMGGLLTDVRPLYGWLGLILAAAGMLWVTFRPLRIRDVVLAFPLLILAAAGGGLGLALQRDAGAVAAATGTQLSRLPLIAAFILVVARVGKGWKGRGQWVHDGLADVTVYVDGRQATFTGLVDTGNCVVHPVTGQPVIIVERAAIRKVIPAGWLRLAGQISGGGSGESDLADPSVRRFSLIPFRSLQGGGDVLPGLRVDCLQLHGSFPFLLRNVVLAVTRESISGEGRYRALIPPDLAKG